MRSSDTGNLDPSGPMDDPPDEEWGYAGDADDPGITGDEILDGDRDENGAPPLHHG